MKNLDKLAKFKAAIYACIARDAYVYISLQL